MHIRSKHFLVGSALLLTFFATQNPLSAKLTGELEKEIQTGWQDCVAQAKVLGSFSCYWKSSLGGGKCIAHPQACTELKREKAKYTEEMYEAAKDDLFKHAGDIKRELLNKLSKSVTSSTKPVSAKTAEEIESGLKELATNCSAKVKAIEDNLKPIKIRYKYLNGTLECK